MTNIYSNIYNAYDLVWVYVWNNCLVSQLCYRQIHTRPQYEVFCLFILEQLYSLILWDGESIGAYWVL